MGFNSGFKGLTSSFRPIYSREYSHRHAKDRILGRFKERKFSTAGNGTPDRHYTDYAIPSANRNEHKVKRKAVPVDTIQLMVGSTNSCMCSRESFRLMYWALCHLEKGTAYLLTGKLGDQRRPGLFGEKGGN